MTRERRGSPRAALSGEAIVYLANERLVCRLLDVSASGMALSCSSGLDPPCFVRIHFTPPERSRPVAVDALLVRRRQLASRVEWGVKLLGRTPELTGTASWKTPGNAGFSEPRRWFPDLDTRLEATDRKRAVQAAERRAQPEPSAPAIQTERSSAGRDRKTGTYPRKWWLVPLSEDGTTQEKRSRNRGRSGNGFGSWMRRR